MASMDESQPGDWMGRTPRTASAIDQLDTKNQLEKGPVPRPPKAPATPNSRQPGGKASRDPKETSAAVEADRRHALQEHQRKTRPGHDRLSPRLAALDLDSVADERPVEAPAPPQSSTSGVFASLSTAVTSAFASAAGAASMAVDAAASALAGRDATFAVDEEVPVPVAVAVPASDAATMAVGATAPAVAGRATAMAVDEEAAVAMEASIEVDEEVVVAEGLAAVASRADVELVVSSVNHADRMSAAAAATEAANLATLRVVKAAVERLEGVVEDGGTITHADVDVCRAPGLVSFQAERGKKKGLGAAKTLLNARTSLDAAMTNVKSRARDQVIGADFDESEGAFDAALRAAETNAEKLAIILARGRLLRAYSVTATLSSDSPVCVLSEDCSGVLSKTRVGVLLKALRKVKGGMDTGGTRLDMLDRLLGVVKGKLAEEPAEDRARASVRRFGACLSVVDAALEAEFFRRLEAAWLPYAEAPGHGPVGHVPFDAAERDRLRAVVKSYQGKPANPIGHVRFGVPLEPGLLPGLNPPRGSAYLVPVDALPRRSIEEFAAGLAKPEKEKPHFYRK